MSASKILALLVALAATSALAGSALAAAPANDNLMQAAQLVGRFDGAEGTNVDATKEPLEPNHAGNPGGASVWYFWTAPGNGTATLSTCDSDFDTLLAVYTGLGPVDALTAVASNNDACGQQSRVEFNAAAGVRYVIAVDGADRATGVVSLTVHLSPPNDDFADAETLAGDAGSTNGTTLGASIEDGEPDHLDLGWYSVWYTWTAPSTGWATFENCGSPFDSVIAVYTGAAVGAVQLVAGNDDGCDTGVASRVGIQASAGTSYMLAVSGYEGDTGDFTLRWSRNPPPPIMAGEPRVLGVPRDGETLTASDGTWTGEGPIQYAYAWGRCDEDTCELIADATSKTYTVRSRDIGFRLWVRVTATNPYGSTRAFSDVTAVVTARAPSNVSSPMVEGDARAGAVVVARPGAWVGTAPLTYAFQWQVCNIAETRCSNLDGQTGQVLRVSTAEAGRVIRVAVTATNAVGSASAVSPGVEVQRLGSRVRCTVPNVRGKTLVAARAAIRRNHCRVGRIQRRFSSAKAGRVIGQSPRAGRRLAAGSRVHVVVSKGRRR